MSSPGGRRGSRTPKAKGPTRFRDGIPRRWQSFRHVMQIRDEDSNLDLHVQSVASCPSTTPEGTGARRPGRPRSVQERDVPHRSRLVLGGHEHTVPAVQDDRVVIRVADGALRPDVRVSDHLAPATTPPLALREPQPIVDGDATRVRVVHEHRLAAVADGELEYVVLAA